MKRVAVTNLSRAQACPIIAVYCDSFLCRLRGLTFRRELAFEEGLLLVERRNSRLDTSIHMLGVFTDLAVIWINDEQRVADARLAKRWRPAYFPKSQARYVLEIHPDRLKEFSVGDQVRFEEV